MTTMMRAVATTRHGGLEMVHKEVPEPGPGKVLIRVERCGICGSDLHAANLYPPGTVLGHEFVGTVARLGSSGARVSVGQRVCCVPAIGCGTCQECLDGDPIHCPTGSLIETAHGGAFAEYVVVAEASCVVVPECVPVAVAALTEPLAVGHKIVQRAAVQPGERVVVLGGGTVGMCVCLWLAILGAGQIVVSDPHQAHRERASVMGATSTVDARRPDLVAALLDISDGGAEVVIDCVGRPGLLASAIDVVRPRGRVVLAGLHAEPEEFFRLSPLKKEVSVLFSNFTRVADFEATLTEIVDGRLDPAALLDEEISLEQLPETFAQLVNSNSKGKVLVNLT